MHRGICKICGGTFWETYKGARGEDLCDHHLQKDDGATLAVYTFHVAASGYGIVEPPLGKGTLAQGCELVHKLNDAYDDWVKRDHPDEPGLHTVWEGCDIGAHPEDGGPILYYSDDADGWEEL